MFYKRRDKKLIIKKENTPHPKPQSQQKTSKLATWRGKTRLLRRHPTRQCLNRYNSRCQRTAQCHRLLGLNLDDRKLLAAKYHLCIQREFKGEKLVCVQFLVIKHYRPANGKPSGFKVAVAQVFPKSRHGVFYYHASLMQRWRT